MEKPSQSALLARPQDLETIVVLDDDPSTALLVRGILQRPVLPYESFMKLKTEASRLTPKAAFIDLDLGTHDWGFTLLPFLRSLWPTSAMVVVTSDPVSDPLEKALEAGADDFILKPLRPEELVARFSYLVAEKDALRLAQIMELGDLRLNLTSRELLGPHGKRQPSRTHCAILKIFIQSFPNLVTKEALRQRVWGKLEVSPNTVEKRVSELRALLGEISLTLSIESEYGQGYLLRNHATQLTSSPRRSSL